MQQFQNLISDILNHGEIRSDRTGVGTVSLFGLMFQHDMTTGFPALTTKRLAFKSMAGELACFVKGFTDVREFHKRGCHIWDANLGADYWANGRDPYDLGRIYGFQWRDFFGTDQLRTVIDEAKRNPNSRRLMVSAWNPADLDMMCLPPCHTHFQLYIREDELDLMFYMRSVDMMLGFPFDVASYGLLQHVIANELGLWAGKLTAFLGDAHIYSNHVQGARELLTRQPRALPVLTLGMRQGQHTEEFEPYMVDLVGYDPHPPIKLEMAV